MYGGRHLRDCIPEGWANCPRWGDPRPLAPLKIIPCKVPLDSKFSRYLPKSCVWTLKEAIVELEQCGLHVGMVMDLTNSTNYYHPEKELEDKEHMDIQYVKIRCRGRGESPPPASVNEAVFHLFQFISRPEMADRYVLMHCTHGFNRTGFMAVSAMMRLLRLFPEAPSLPEAITKFARSRYPGIYKPRYVADLYDYYHVARDTRLQLAPAVPAWKGESAEDEADEANEAADGVEAEAAVAAAAATAAPSHEDIFSIGEAVCKDEELWVQQTVLGCFPEWQNHRFPGSQPVSVTQANLYDIPKRRYYVTWKADGTRYLLLVSRLGAHLINRDFRAARVEMRFPAIPAGRSPALPQGRALDAACLDGEMVIDEVGGGHVMRYLVYDMCAVGSDRLYTKPFKDRYKAIQTYITDPRAEDRRFMDVQRAALRQGALPKTAPYEYEKERFRVRQKGFWPLHLTQKVLEDFNKHLSHETDGLIFQGWNEPYKCGTCDELLKWKYLHLNSVDFVLNINSNSTLNNRGLVPADANTHGESEFGSEGWNRGPNGTAGAKLEVVSGIAPMFQLLLLEKSGAGGTTLVPLEKVVEQRGYKVAFPEGVDPMSYHDCVIECSFNESTHTWIFMRERVDKGYHAANAFWVFTKVLDSIVRPVHKTDILEVVDTAVKTGEDYTEERAMLEADELKRRAAAAGSSGGGGGIMGTHMSDGDAGARSYHGAGGACDNYGAETAGYGADVYDAGDGDRGIGVGAADSVAWG